MILQSSFTPSSINSKAPASPTAQAEPNPPSGDVVELRGSKTGRAAAVLGGSLAGVAASGASSVAVVAAGHELLKLVASSVPHVSNAFVASMLHQSLTFTSLAQPAVLLGVAALGVVQGARAGGAIAYEAASGATKLDLAKTPPPVINSTAGLDNLLAVHRESGAELRQHLGETLHASSVKSAVGSGFESATCLLGPAAGAAGKIQGLLMGFVVGGATGIPLLSLVNHPAVLLPTAIAGAVLGTKIGSYLGYAAGTGASAVVGGVGGAVAHGLTGHHKE